MDYGKCSLEELTKMSDEAYAAYYREATKPCGNWYPGMTFPELEKAENAYEEIRCEIEKRTKGS